MKQLGQTKEEGEILAFFEKVRQPISIKEAVRRIPEETGMGRADVLDRTRLLISRGCIMVTKDWKLTLSPGHSHDH